VLAVVLFTPGTGLAEKSLPGFDMVSCTCRASVIVRGRLDAEGKLVVAEVYHGRPGDKPLGLRDGGDGYAGLNRIKEEGGPREVVGLLRGDGGRGWEAVWGKSGVVRLAGAEVHAYLEAQKLAGGPILARHPRYTRATFLKALGEAVGVVRERDRLL